MESRSLEKNRKSTSNAKIKKDCNKRGYDSKPSNFKKKLSGNHSNQSNGKNPNNGKHSNKRGKFEKRAEQEPMNQKSMMQKLRGQKTTNQESISRNPPPVPRSAPSFCAISTPWAHTPRR